MPLLLLLALSQGCATCPGGKGRIKIFVLAGQSNAVGYNHVRELAGGAALVDRLAACQPPVRFWAGSNAMPGQAARWGVMRLGAAGIALRKAYRGGCFGPEVGFALALRRALPAEEIGIIKYAWGATGIARSRDYKDYIAKVGKYRDRDLNWHPPGDGGPTGLLYQQLIIDVRAAIRALEWQGLEVELCGFLWMQGEHEAGLSPTMARDYPRLLDTLRRSIRSDLGAPELPFVVGQVNGHSWAYGDIARQGQEETCRIDRRSVLVETLDLPRGGVGGKAHFDATGMLELGRRSGGAMVQLLGGGPARQPIR